MERVPVVLRPASVRGFTLVEMVVVVAIIGLLMAVGAPPIRNYMREANIRVAASQFASEIQAARQRAISKNVHLGVVFLLRSANTYQWVIEDDQSVPLTSGVRLAMSVLVADAAQTGPLRTRPASVTFTTAGPTSRGIRFTSLGATCDPNSAVCPQPDIPVAGPGVPAAGLVNFGTINPAEFTIRLTDATTTLSRSVRVTTNGRIFIQN